MHWWLFVKFGSDENNTIDIEGSEVRAVQRKPQVHMAVGMKMSLKRLAFKYKKHEELDKWISEGGELDWREPGQKAHSIVE